MWLPTWWWLPLPLVMISTPASAILMCGELGVNSSSQVSLPSTASEKHSAASPKGQVRCPVASATDVGSRKSSSCPGRFQVLK